MSKISIRYIKNIINELNIKESEFYEYKNKVKQKLENINIDEFKFLKYKEMKEICNLLKYKVDNNLMNKLLKIKNDKKIEEYPELLDAHYFKEILQLDYISKQQRKELDYTLNRFKKWGNINEYRIFEEYSSNPINKELRRKVLNFLIENKIIEEVYVFYCDDEIKCISKEYRDKFYRYFELLESEDNINFSNKEYEELRNLEENGYCEFYVDGYYSGGYCVDSIEYFEKNMKISYKVIKEPDLSLDEV